MLNICACSLSVDSFHLWKLCWAAKTITRVFIHSVCERCFWFMKHLKAQSLRFAAHSTTTSDSVWSTLRFLNLDVARVQHLVCRPCGLVDVLFKDFIFNWILLDVFPDSTAWVTLKLPHKLMFYFVQWDLILCEIIDYLLGVIKVLK